MCEKTPAQLPHLGGSDMGTKTMQQSIGSARLLQPPSGRKPETRLPGVRQLLMLDALVPSDISHTSIQQSPGQSYPLAMATKTAPSEIFSSPSKRPLETNFNPLRSSELGTSIGNHQDIETSRSSARVPVNQKSTSYFSRNCAPRSSGAPPPRESLLSPRCHRLNSARPCKSSCPSPSSDYSGSVDLGTIPRQCSVSSDVDQHPPGPGSVWTWHVAPKLRDWGTTKAGKPRKRLAQACLNCRQKKIRCRPIPNCARCTQCDKSDINCTFESLFGHSCPGPATQRDPYQVSADFPTAAHATSPTISADNGHGSTIQGQLKSYSLTTVSQGMPFTSASSEPPEHGTWPWKRRKRVGDPVQERLGSMPPTLPLHGSSNAPSSTANPARTLDTADDDGSGFAASKWADFTSASPLTMQYMDLYFLHVNQTIYHMLPQRPFSMWVRYCCDKSSDDKMVLYTLMAMGCRFSADKESRAHGKSLLQLARHAEQSSLGRVTLQLVQTRLILTLLHFSLGNTNQAWEYYATAVAAVSALKYNTEEGVTEPPHLTDCEYGLDRKTLSECRRRTFWSAFVMERYQTFCCGHLSMLHIDDCFLRLPCKEARYESQDIPDTPNLAMIHQKNPSWQEHASLGNMAFLIIIASVWGDVQQYLYRLRYRVASAEASGYEGYYREKQRQLQAFVDRLPSHLFPCNTPNIQRAMQEGYIGTLISVHEVYHATVMKVNRHGVHAELEEETMKRNLRAAQFHAREILTIYNRLSNLYHESRSWSPASICSMPFQGYAILSATDILTSFGTLTDLRSDLKVVQGSLEIVQEASNYWRGAQQQREMIAARVREVTRALCSGSAEENKVFLLKDPIDDALGRELDVLFSPAVMKRFEASGLAEAFADGKAVLFI